MRAAEQICIIGAPLGGAQVSPLFPPVFAAFDPSHMGNSIALSNSNLTATFGAAFWSTVFATISKSAGKFYDEVTATDAVGFNSGTVGFANSSAGVNGSYPGNLSSGIGWVSEGEVLVNNVTVATIASWTTGSVLGRALDLDNRKVWFRVDGGGWNNDILANQNPATNTGGISLSGVDPGPYFPGVAMNTNGTIFTENFGQTSYAHAAPSGFLNWTAQPTAPQINNTVANQAVYPGLYSSLPFITVGLVDNNGGATVAVTITLSGAAGTLAGTGLSGAGPYTIAADIPANVTAILNELVFSTANTIGHATTFTVSVVSSTGKTVSNSATSTIVSTYVAETSFTAPSGSFTQTSLWGINTSGGENVPNSNYPFTFQLDYYASKVPFGLIRLPFSSQNLATTAFALLNSTEVSKIKAILDYAMTKNLFVDLDLHNYGGIWDSRAGVGGSGGYRAAASSDLVGRDLFKDMWTRLSKLFVNYPNVVWGLMNEPSAGGVSAAQWRDCAIPGVVAIRANGANQLVLIPGISFTGAHAWTTSGNAAAWAGFNSDTANNFMFEMHQYLDSDDSGTSPFAVTGKGATVLDADGATTWLAAQGFKGFLGEFGFAPDPWKPGFGGNPMNYLSTATPVATGGITEGSAMMQFMADHPLQWDGGAYWAGGDFPQPPNDNGYAYSIDPPFTGSGYTPTVVDQPQMAVLVNDLSQTLTFPSPWSVFAGGTGSTPSVTNNADVAPNGTFTATKIIFGRSSTGGQSNITLTFTGTAASYTEGLWVKAVSGADVGLQLTLSFYDGTNIVGATAVTLTSSWQFVSATATLTTSSSCQMLLGLFNGSGVGQTGTVNALVWNFHH